MRQLGLVNVYDMESSDGDREREIVENVVSYGKQLGRNVEAPEEVPISHAKTSTRTTTRTGRSCTFRRWPGK